LHVANVHFADLSGAFALQEALGDWARAGIDVLAVKLSDPTKSTLAKLGIDFANSYDTVTDAIAHIAFGDVEPAVASDEPPVDHDM